ncbi:MAG: hypothetical protein C5B53_04465 [Candidatus Melainabacteria bacterium]|nr:MAG: hypothetical protein C5B53_04465 [Candidatus Melainabacteria bacterium]
MVRLPTFIFIVLVLLSNACSRNEPNTGKHKASEDKAAVAVERLPPEVQRKELDIPGRRGLRSEGPHTDWFFHCYTNFAYTLTDEQKSGTGTTVRITITKVNIKITLPIVMWIPKNAAQKVIDHEKGHVRICTRIYENAESAARDAATRVVGSNFQGQGDTVEAAYVEAVNKAAEEVCTTYRKNTADKADGVSKIYDDLTAGSTTLMSVDRSIDEAFNRFLR